MSDDQAYIGRSLTERSREVAALIAATLDVSMRKAAATQSLASGNTLRTLRVEALRVLSEEFEKAAQFVFNYTGRTDGDVQRDLAFFGSKNFDIIMQQLADCGMRTGIAEVTVAREIESIRQALAERRDRLIDDFTHGMIGNERLKKDPVVSIVNSQSNSPGAIQQLGVGEFSQTAFIQQHHQLISAIDRALASSEFAKLEEAQKHGFQDIADAVKNEAAKQAPDQGKLKRWTSRLVDLANELGMRVAVSEIGQLFRAIFGG